MMREMFINKKDQAFKFKKNETATYQINSCILHFAIYYSTPLLV
jgi:hypothetical protein